MTTAQTAERVVILGKKDNFLYIAPTFAEGVSYVNEYTSGMWEGHEPPPNQKGRLTAADLDFFDGLGQPLTLCRDGAGNPRRLEITEPVTDAEAEVRYRIAAVYQAATYQLKLRVAAGDEVDDNPPALPSAELAFPQFLEEISDDPRAQFERGPNCSWFLRVLGWCG